jgi:hypothetical protein
VADLVGGWACEDLNLGSLPYQILSWLGSIAWTSSRTASSRLGLRWQILLVKVVRQAAVPELVLGRLSARRSWRSARINYD